MSTTKHATVTPDAVPDLSNYDLLAPQLSGGKDSALMMWLFMEAARTAGVTDRVRSYHASLGLLEWPEIFFDGRRWPGVCELAAQQSSAFGVPPGRHIEVTRTVPGTDGIRRPHSLLTEMAAYGRFPRLGTRYCTKSAKDSVISAAWTPFVRERRPLLRRPVRILKVMGQRRDESRDRAQLAPYRNVLANSARVVDEWLPALDWRTPAVWEWSSDAPVPPHWTYDSVPGAGDQGGTSRCSCALCVFGSKRDLLLTVGRRPRLAALYEEVERVRGDSFRPDRRLHELIHLAQGPGAPEPGIVCPDDGPEFDALEEQVRAALARPPRKEIELAALGRTPCQQCACA
ncbi:MULTISPECIES: phosphoadenosine phosphosulfate reductase [unclassified Streptomyces]|uniref:phosphoadenosine phosphosulfate reductase n=1 Tax=unclassified Streptomyces TaxID=2593676 RepID=UPI002DDC2C27|nr:phosphoadenosine phosphosulfate reductase [Streptomyces sp. NBC_01795]WSA97766.1 phosphoadenosine phosphosulfate reductase [Streptomyces sp. NBC_01795]WSS46717.1 phosphoadenosine phosphosulfate reductase [Streptomyces sp. NBC_01187]WSS47066.1 phosphoadenosine phosphosulfate reductase [Streptomyces sp. NBC_01187]